MHGPWTQGSKEGITYLAIKSRAREDMTAMADDWRQRMTQKKTGWGGRGGG